MIDISHFIEYIDRTFEANTIRREEFKPGVWFMEVDCFVHKDYKLALSISQEDIRIATITKIPSIDFSPYDYVFYENEAAVELIDRVYREQNFS